MANPSVRRVQFTDELIAAAQKNPTRGGTGDNCAKIKENDGKSALQQALDGSKKYLRAQGFIPGDEQERD